MRAWVLCTMLCGCAASNDRSPPDSSREAKAHREIAIGDRAPEVAPGNVTLVVFWATWSAPGKYACVQVEEIWQKRRARGLAVKSVSIDDEATGLDDFRKSNGMTYAVEWDRGHRLADVYRVSHEPTLYVVDRRGVVRFVHRGWHDGEASEVAAEADSLL